MVRWPLSADRYRLSAVGYRLSAVGYRLSAIGCRLSAVGCRLSAIGYRLSAGEVGALGGRQYKCRLWRRKPYNRPAGVGSAFPLWWLAPPPFPRKRGHYKAPLCCERLMKGMLRGVLFFPLNRGKSGAARIGGGERSEPVSRIVFMPYDTEK